MCFCYAIYLVLFGSILLVLNYLQLTDCVLRLAAKAVQY